MIVIDEDFKDFLTERQTWTAEQNRAAAAVLGIEVSCLLHIAEVFAYTHSSEINDETVRIARGMAEDAAHYALTALEMEGAG